MFRVVLDDLPGEDGFYDFIELDALSHHLLLRVLRDANLLVSYLFAATCLKGSDVIDWQKFTSLPDILAYHRRSTKPASRPWWIPSLPRQR